MAWIQIDSVTDARLDPYRNLRTTNLTRASGLFIAESKPLVQRLVASPLAIHSVLLDRDYVDDASSWLPDHCDVFMVEGSAVSELIGFNFHRGYLGCGIRPARKTWDARDWKIANAACYTTDNVNVRNRSNHVIVMLVGVQDPENMGSIIRSCAALGIDSILLGPNCVDPFARRVLRVSMGNAFKMQFYEVADVAAAISDMQKNGIRTYSTFLSADSQSIQECTRAEHSAVIFGNEAHGLPNSIAYLTEHRIMIPMELNTDSLNVSVAAGIILHYFKRAQKTVHDC